MSFLIDNVFRFPIFSSSFSWSLEYQNICFYIQSLTHNFYIIPLVSSTPFSYPHLPVQILPTMPFRSLQELNLDKNLLVDFVVLSFLPSLGVLRLSYNRIESVRREQAFYTQYQRTMLLVATNACARQYDHAIFVLK